VILQGSSDPYARPLEQRRKHMITLAAGLTVAPVALVQFYKNGIFLHFPFHPDADGLVSRMTLQPGEADADLAAEGAVTSQRVKFAHHVDGRAHFSQDTRVRTVIRNQARPLTGQVPHLFTIDVQALDHFAMEYEEWERHRRKYGDAYFEFRLPEFPESVHIVGRWIRVSEAERLAEVRNPVTILGNWERQAAACAPDPSSDLHGGVLTIEAYPRDPMTAGRDFQVFCIAGFDEHAGDNTKPGSALVLIYPHEDDDDLPSIDWTPRTER
jgi:hypothetical protein